MTFTSYTTYMKSKSPGFWSLYPIQVGMSRTVKLKVYVKQLSARPASYSQKIFMWKKTINLIAIMY